VNEHLTALESAISDVGHWTWWTANLPDTFQVEFNGTQLWNPPLGEGKPPSGQIALRFRKPRRVYFLTLSDSVSIPAQSGRRSRTASHSARRAIGIQLAT
jgi:hypothetical protein